MANNTEQNERLMRLLEVSDILDEIDYRFQAFIKNFVQIEIDKAKAAGYGERDRNTIRTELERIKNVYIQEVKREKQEFIQDIFLKMKPDLYKLTLEEVELIIDFFESKPGKNFKKIIIPLSETINKTITEIGKTIIKEA